MSSFAFPIREDVSETFDALVDRVLVFPKLDRRATPLFTSTTCQPDDYGIANESCLL